MKASQGVRMDNFGNYLTIKQAKNFLSERINSKVSKLNLLEMAARGDIKLCVLFDGNVAEFQYKYPNPVCASNWTYKLKSAYIKIPSDAVNLKGGIITINSIKIVEVIRNSDYKADHSFYGGGCESLPKLRNGLFYGAYTSDTENVGNVKFAAFEANIDEAVIPKDDLLNLIEQSQNTAEEIEHQTIKPKIEPEIVSTYQPRNGVGKLAVKAAKEIEQSTGQRATTDQVMKTLQKWASDGTHSDCLREPGNLCVVWTTLKNNPKGFTIGACEKVLRNWNDGRDKSNLERR